MGRKILKRKRRQKKELKGKEERKNKESSKAINFPPRKKFLGFLEIQHGANNMIPIRKGTHVKRQITFVNVKD